LTYYLVIWAWLAGCLIYLVRTCQVTCGFINFTSIPRSASSCAISSSYFYRKLHTVLQIKTTSLCAYDQGRLPSVCYNNNQRGSFVVIKKVNLWSNTVNTGTVYTIRSVVYTRPARANYGPRDKMAICEHRPLSLWKLPMINNIRTFYRDFRAPLSTPGPRYFAPLPPPPLASLGYIQGVLSLWCTWTYFQGGEFEYSREYSIQFALTIIL
jgi:hypothetical protein